MKLGLWFLAIAALYAYHKIASSLDALHHRFMLLEEEIRNSHRKE